MDRTINLVNCTGTLTANNGFPTPDRVTFGVRFDDERKALSTFAPYTELNKLKVHGASVTHRGVRYVRNTKSPYGDVVEIHFGGPRQRVAIVPTREFANKAFVLI